MSVFLPGKEMKILWTGGGDALTDIPDKLFWYANVGAHGLVLLTFGLSFIRSAAMRFIYYLAFIISNVAGPWGGYWFFLGWYILIYFID